MWSAVIPEIVLAASPLVSTGPAIFRIVRKTRIARIPIIPPANLSGEIVSVWVVSRIAIVLPDGPAISRVLSASNFPLRPPGISSLMDRVSWCRRVAYPAYMHA